MVFLSYLISLLSSCVSNIIAAEVVNRAFLDQHLQKGRLDNLSSWKQLNFHSNKTTLQNLFHFLECVEV